MASITVTLFPSARNTQPIDTLEGPWSEFIEALPTLLRKEATDKTQLIGLVFAPFKGTRKNANSGDHTAVVIDIDQTPNGLQSFLKTLRPYQAVAYETPSSTAREPRLRVIAALDKPIPVGAVRAARLAFARELGLDPKESGVAQANSASGLMFIGQISGTHRRRHWVFKGEPWSLDQPAEVIDIATGQPRERNADVTPEHGRALDISALLELCPPSGEAGQKRKLTRAIGGWAGKQGFSDDAIATAVKEVPTRYTRQRVKDALEAARQARTGAVTAGWRELGEWLEEVGESDDGVAMAEFERANEDPWVRDYVEKDRSAVRAAGAHQKPPTVDANGKALHPLTGWPWVIQHGNSFWFHEVDKPEYDSRSCSAQELEVGLSEKMSGYLDMCEITLSELRRDWVHLGREVVKSYNERWSRYDPDTRTLRVAALRWSTRKPKRHDDVDLWLQTLAGKMYPRLVQWIASLCDLTRPAPCLVLTGDGLLGKSLLFSGLSQIWCQPFAVRMSDLVTTRGAVYNEHLGVCPLVVAEEALPPGLEFTQFRELITSTHQSVNNKFGAKGAVEGFGRFALTSNSEEPLRYQKTGPMSKSEVVSLLDRLLLVHCQPEAGEMLRDLDTVEMAERTIAEHALWIAKTIPLEPRSQRMAARPAGGEELINQSRAHRFENVLAALSLALVGGETVRERYGIDVVEDVSLRVHFPTFSDALEAHGVTRREVRDAFKALRLEGVKNRRRKDGTQQKVHVLDLPLVRTLIEVLDG